MQKSQKDVSSYIRETAGTGGRADELSKLAELKNHGTSRPRSSRQAKAKVLAA